VGVQALKKITQTTRFSEVKKKPRSLQQWIFDIAKYCLLVFISTSYIFPLYWMFSSALKDDPQVYVVPPVWVPDPAFWENFVIGWTRLPFTLYFYNTVVKYALPVVIGTVLSSAIVAYGFSRIKFKGRNALFGICLATMMIPSR
jgi:multiple sugar transport system permease protein